MAVPIPGIGGIGSLPITAPVAPAGPSSPGAFGNVLASAINNVEGVRAGADVQIQRFLTGENQELHEVVLATQRAELSLELFQQVRNKVVQAYQEVMRMQM